ncbi:DMT family transporter [Clostridium mediterraneense]|uniref:DMT family transporter n=1 Tax=Clostridium mediterraneense TaxID=1805472 RepID=UPI00082BDFE0|nr:DMT family transporter [Clostridium mediterraneense]
MNKLTKAIILMLISSLGYTGMALFIKLAGNDIPVIQKIFFRNLITFFVALYLIIKRKQSFTGHKGSRGALLLRGGMGTLGALANFYGIEHLMLPNATIIKQLGPFFIIIFSFLFLKEKIKKFQIGALIVAFLGIIVIVGPGSHIALIPSMVELFSAVSAGIVFTCVRFLKDKESAETIVFWNSVVSIVISLPFLIFDYTYMSPIQIIYLLLAGVCTVLGQFGSTIAYRFAPAKDISIFSYSQVIFATIASVIIFDAIPTLNNFIGYLIIIIAAFISFLYSRKVGKTKN